MCGDLGTGLRDTGPKRPRPAVLIKSRGRLARGTARFTKTSLCADALWDMLRVIRHPHLRALTRMLP